MSNASSSCLYVRGQPQPSLALFGNTLYAGRDDTYISFDVDELAKKHFTSSPPPPLDSTVSIALSKDGALLATGHLSGKVRLWKTKDSSLCNEFDAQANAVHSLHFVTETQILTCALWPPKTDFNKEFVPRNQMWGFTRIDIETGQATYFLPFLCTTYFIHPSRPFILTADAEGQLKAWDITTAKVKGSNTTQGLNSPTFAIVANDGFTRIVSVHQEDGKNVLLQFFDEECEQPQFWGHKLKIEACALKLSSDQTQVFIAHTNLYITLWSLIEEGSLLKTIPYDEECIPSPLSAIAFSEDKIFQITSSGEITHFKS